MWDKFRKTYNADFFLPCCNCRNSNCGVMKETQTCGELQNYGLRENNRNIDCEGEIKTQTLGGNYRITDCEGFTATQM